MVLEKRSTRFGAALIIFAVLLRLAGAWGIFAQAFRQPQMQQPEQAGGVIRETTGSLAPTESSAATQPPPTQVPSTAPAPPPTEPIPVSYGFSEADGQYLHLAYASDCKYRPNLQNLLMKALEWDLSGAEPKVLIIHSHSSESYTRQAGQTYQETAMFRTLNESYNMIAVGDALAEALEAAGIGVIHDRQIHDYPSYNDAYNHTRNAIRSYLDQYPTIQVVLDLHRDAAQNPDGSQFATGAVVNGQKVAQLMLVVGSGSASNHPNWQENLSAAVKLQVLLEKLAPGITRPSILRGQRFNQDLSAGALLVEVGSAGNTLQEALGTIPVLAQALALLMHGANQTE